MSSISGRQTLRLLPLSSMTFLKWLSLASLLLPQAASTNAAVPSKTVFFHVFSFEG